MCNEPLFSRCGRPLLVAGGPFRDDRRVAESIIQRYRCGIAWRDVPAELVVADDLEAAPPLQRLRNLGQYPGRAVDGGGFSPCGGLVDLSGLDSEPRAPARHQPSARHRGTRRKT